MILITPAIRKTLETKGSKEYPPLKPVVKIFNPYGNGTWWISYIKDGIAFGYANLRQRTEFGPIGLEELINLRFKVSAGGREAMMGLERDLNWNPNTGWDLKRSVPIGT